VRSQSSVKRFGIQYWGLLATLIMLFFLGGSSRSDAQSLLLLSPVIVLLSGIGLSTLSSVQLRIYKFSFGGFGIIALLALIHSIPFTELVGLSSQGLIDIETVRRDVGLSSISSEQGVSFNLPWASIFSLFAPFSVYLFAIQLERGELSRTLAPVAFLGLISAVLGLSQLIGGRNAPLYLYQITNEGSAVGLFANRNHAAVFLSCLFPAWTVFAGSEGLSRKFNPKLTLLLSAIGAMLLILLILMTGSRAGLLTGVIGIFGAILLYSSKKKSSPETKNASRSRLLTLISVLFLIGCLVFLSIYFSRALAVDRLFQVEGAANIRGSIWRASYPLFWLYFPLGFGSGSFGSVFTYIEPLGLLSSTYVNRLHNDWLETALTFGVPGILLMLAGVGYYLRRSFVLWMRMDGARSAVALGRMASIVIAILGIASLSDYPLRTPAMAGFAALVLVWFAHARYDPNLR
jgi:O-antigen ligase